MTAGWGGGFKDWGELRAHLIDTYGDTPRPETEAVIIAAYEAHPAALEHAAQSVAVDVTNGTVRSGWAVLRSRAGSITTPQANPTRKSGVELEKRTARAKQWIHNAGMHYDRPDEIEDELFDRGLLRDYAGDSSLRDEMLHAWAEERPTGLQIERDTEARAQAWKEAQHLMRQKLAAAHAQEDTCTNTPTTSSPAPAAQASASASRSSSDGPRYPSPSASASSSAGSSQPVANDDTPL